MRWMGLWSVRWLRIRWWRPMCPWLLMCLWGVMGWGMLWFRWGLLGLLGPKWTNWGVWRGFEMLGVFRRMLWLGSRVLWSRTIFRLWRRVLRGGSDPAGLWWGCAMFGVGIRIRLIVYGLWVR